MSKTGRTTLCALLLVVPAVGTSEAQPPQPPPSYPAPTITRVYGPGDGSSTNVRGDLRVEIDDAPQPKVRIWYQRGSDDWQNQTRDSTSDDVYVINAWRGYRYKVYAENCDNSDPIVCGAVSATVEGAIPSIPVKSISPVGGGDTSIRFSWSNEGEPPSSVSYQVGYNTDTNATAPLDDSKGFTTAAPYEFTGLSRRTAYRMFVRTVVRSSTDDSAILDSATSVWKWSAASTVPPPPGLELTRASSSSLSFWWHIDGNNYWRYRYKETSDSWPADQNNMPMGYTDVFSNVATAHLYDLISGTSYDIQVGACTSTAHDTCSLPSEATGSTTGSPPGPPPDPPPAPTNVRISHLDQASTMLQVDWNTTEEGHWSHVRYKESTASDWSEWSGSIRAGWYRMFELTADTVYVVQVKACLYWPDNICSDPVEVTGRTPPELVIPTVQNRPVVGENEVRLCWVSGQANQMSGFRAQAASARGAAASSGCGSSSSSLDVASRSLDVTASADDDDSTDPNYEVSWAEEEADWSTSQSVVVSGTTALIDGLTDGQEYKFRVRETTGEANSGWSDEVHATPGPATVSTEFPDLMLAHDQMHDLDMTEYFKGSNLEYSVLVTTTHNQTGVVRTAPINTVARNKVRGAWDEDVLTLTAGPTGDHELTLEITASNNVGAASDSFELTVGAGDDDPGDGDDPATLVQEFSDLSLANSVTHELDMGEHFTGSGVTYGVMVTTTNNRTGQVRTGPINTVARNKVTGGWSGEVLTLTTGPEGEHVLGLEITATDAAGGTASDDFQLTVGAADAEILRHAAPVPALPVFAQLVLAAFMIIAGTRFRQRRR